MKADSDTLIQPLYSLQNTTKENTCLPGTGREKVVLMHRSGMETSPWLNGHYCSEHLCTALFQLQGHAHSLGCSKLVHTWVVSPERVLKALWVLCMWDPERSLPLCAFTTRGWSERDSTSAVILLISRHPSGALLWSLLLGASKVPLLNESHNGSRYGTSSSNSHFEIDMETDVC